MHHYLDKLLQFSDQFVVAPWFRFLCSLNIKISLLVPPQPTQHSHINVCNHDNNNINNNNNNYICCVLFSAKKKKQKI